MRTTPRIRVWTAPILLGVSMAVGLSAALLSNGFGDYLAWVTLAIPILVVLSCMRPRRARRSETETSMLADAAEKPQVDRRVSGLWLQSGEE